MLFAGVDNGAAGVYNLLSKDFDGKFCTNPRHIIRNHSFFKERKKTDNYKKALKTLGRDFLPCRFAAAFG